MNHFETARFYGSSEVQFVNALVELIDAGTIKRSDFIFQTKLMVGAATTKDEFEKQWEASWSNVHKLGYVDLMSFHCVSESEQVDNILSESVGIMASVESLKEEGKIKHVGFSTHGSAENIMQMINSEKMEYVNIHHHFFGDYHAAGTPDTQGGEGNAACVKRALELDMGVFNISPFDKGGKLYRPSATVAAAIGHEISPIVFAALRSWKEGMHTVSVGFARSSDLDEVIAAARIFAEGDKGEALVKAAVDRLENIATEKLGKEWFEKGLLNIPSFYDKSTDGIAIGHLLWLHNCLTAYGLEECCKNRYSMNEAIKWSKSKSFEENKKKSFNPGNPGRAFDESIDLTEALKNHYNPDLAKSKLVEVHNWLCKDTNISDNEKLRLGWKKAYNLTTWEEFPGEVISVSNVILSRMGIKSGGGNADGAKEEAGVMRGKVRKSSSSLNLVEKDVKRRSSQLGKDQWNKE